MPTRGRRDVFAVLVARTDRRVRAGSAGLARCRRRHLRCKQGGRGNEQAKQRMSPAWQHSVGRMLVKDSPPTRQFRLTAPGSHPTPRGSERVSRFVNAVVFVTTAG